LFKDTRPLVSGNDIKSLLLTIRKVEIHNIIKHTPKEQTAAGLSPEIHQFHSISGHHKTYQYST